MSKPSSGAAARILSEPAITPIRSAGEPVPGSEPCLDPTARSATVQALTVGPCATRGFARTGEGIRAASCEDGVAAAARSETALAGGIRAQALALLRDAGGATAIEYAMIGGLIFAVVAGSIRAYGSRVDAVYGRIGSAISQVN